MIWIIFLPAYIFPTLISYFFLAFPSILHPKTTLPASINSLFSPDKILIMAHRGGLLEAPENTLLAFQRALSLNIPALELDVYKTKDEKLIACHNETLEKITGQEEKVSELNYSEINTYLPVIDNSYKEYVLKQNELGVKPALLSDVFSLAQESNKSILFNIDTKTDDSERFVEILNLADDFNLIENIVIGSFSVYDLDFIKDKYEKKPNFLFPSTPVYMSIAAFLLGVLPYIRYDYSFYETTFAFKETSGLGDYNGSGFGTAIMRVMDFFWPLTELLNWGIKRRGIKVIYWTVNTAEDLDTAIKIGAEGVITDYPEKMKQWLIDRDLF